MKHINDWQVKVDVKYKNPFNIKDTFPIDKAISKFNRKIKESGLMVELQDRTHFTSKSAKRRKQKNAGKYRNSIK